LTVAWLLNLFIAEFLIRNQRSERPVESPMRAT
jgi:hypothetical protein